MRKILILSSVLLIAIVVIASEYFSELSGNTNNFTKVLNNIPSDASVIISFSNDDSFHEIFKDYKPFDDVIGAEKATEQRLLYISLLNQQPLQQIAEGGRVFLSFHPSKNGSINFLYSMTLNGKFSADNISNSLYALRGVKIDKERNGIFVLHLPNAKANFYLYVAKGMACGSFSEELVKRATSDATTKISQTFIGEINKNLLRDESSPINLFIDHRSFSRFFSSFVRGRSDGNSSLLNNISGFSSLGMNFKSDALMFNGLSTPDTSTRCYLNLFLHQRPVFNQLKEQLPENTANYIMFGVSDFLKFHDELEKYFSQKGEGNQLKGLNNYVEKVSGISTKRDILPLLGNEFSVIETISRERFGLIKVANGTEINTRLKLISTQVASDIWRFNHSNLLYYYYGDPFKTFLKPYFAVIDNFLVVANTSEMVQKYLDDYTHRRFLASNQDFNGHDQLVANQSNVLYSINLKNSFAVIRTVLKKELAQSFESSNFGFRKFYGMSCQWSSDGVHFQANIYANYLPGGAASLQSFSDSSQHPMSNR